MAPSSGLRHLHGSHVDHSIDGRLRWDAALTNRRHQDHDDGQNHPTTLAQRLRRQNDNSHATISVAFLRYHSFKVLRSFNDIERLVDLSLEPVLFLNQIPMVT